MMAITVLSLLIVVVVVFIVHSGKEDVTESIPISEDSVAIGSWETDGSGAAEGEEKTMNEVSLTLDGKGQAEGTFGKYEYEGTWQLASEFEVRLINNKGEAVYKGIIDPEGGDEGAPVMELKSQNVTDSMTWTLLKTK